MARWAIIPRDRDDLGMAGDSPKANSQRQNHDLRTQSSWPLSHAVAQRAVADIDPQQTHPLKNRKLTMCSEEIHRKQKSIRKALYRPCALTEIH